MNITELKPAQEKALYNFMTRRDVFAVLPTEFGKSLIFELVPDVCQLLHERGFDYPKNAVIIVACPLNALIESHIKELVVNGVKAIYLSKDHVGNTELLAAQYPVVFTSPELVVLESTWRTVQE